MPKAVDEDRAIMEVGKAKSPTELFKMSIKEKLRELEQLERAHDNSMIKDGDHTNQVTDTESMHEKAPEINDIEQMTTINKRMTGRQSRGKLAKKYLIYPDDKIAGIWEFFTTV